MKFHVLIYILLVFSSSVADVMSVDCNSNPTDLIFVLDESGSVHESNFKLQLEFVAKFVEKFDIGKTATQVGLLTFSTYVVEEFQLDSYENKPDLLKGIRNVTYFHPGLTNTNIALDHVRTSFALTSKGFRPSARHILIVMTDGESMNTASTIESARKLHALDFVMLAVGITDEVKRYELDGIASDFSNVITVANFSALESQRARFIQTTCRAIIKPNPVLTINRNCTSKPTDIIFVLDESGSVHESNFKLQLEFVAKFVETFDIGKTATQVGLLTFSTYVVEEFQLDSYTNKQDLLQGIRNVTYFHPGLTNTKMALDHVRTSFALTSKGFRPSARHIVVVMTDGESMNTTTTIESARKLHALNYVMLAVGISQEVKQSELDGIASDVKNVVTVADFASLESHRDLLTQRTCQAITAPIIDNNCKNRPTDIIFVLDESGSVHEPNFKLQMEFVAKFVESFEIGKAATQVGLLTFSTHVVEEFQLDLNQNKQDLLRALRNVSYSHPGLTNTDMALDYVRTSFALPSKGLRPSAVHLLIVMTDGMSSNSILTLISARKLHALDFNVIAIGITSQVDQSELNNIASDVDYVITAANFSVLESHSRQFTQTTCKAITKPKSVQNATKGSHTWTSSASVLTNGARLKTTSTGLMTTLPPLTTNGGISVNGFIRSSAVPGLSTKGNVSNTSPSQTVRYNITMYPGNRSTLRPYLTQNTNDNRINGSGYSNSLFNLNRSSTYIPGSLNGPATKLIPKIQSHLTVHITAHTGPTGVTRLPLFNTPTGNRSSQTITTYHYPNHIPTGNRSAQMITTYYNSNITPTGNRSAQMITTYRNPNHTPTENRSAQMITTYHNSNNTFTGNRSTQKITTYRNPNHPPTGNRSAKMNTIYHNLNHTPTGKSSAQMITTYPKPNQTPTGNRSAQLITTYHNPNHTPTGNRSAQMNTIYRNPNHTSTGNRSAQMITTYHNSNQTPTGNRSAQVITTHHNPNHTPSGNRSAQMITKYHNPNQTTTGNRSVHMITTHRYPYRTPTGNRSAQMITTYRNPNHTPTGNSSAQMITIYRNPNHTPTGNRSAQMLTTYHNSNQTPTGNRSAQMITKYHNPNQTPTGNRSVHMITTHRYPYQTPTGNRSAQMITTYRNPNHTPTGNRSAQMSTTYRNPFHAPAGNRSALKITTYNNPNHTPTGNRSAQMITAYYNPYRTTNHYRQNGGRSGTSQIQAFSGTPANAHGRLTSKNNSVSFLGMSKMSTTTTVHNTNINSHGQSVTSRNVFNISHLTTNAYGSMLLGNAGSTRNYQASQTSPSNHMQRSTRGRTQQMGSLGNNIKTSITPPHQTTSLRPGPNGYKITDNPSLINAIILSSRTTVVSNVRNTSNTNNQIPGYLGNGNNFKPGGGNTHVSPSNIRNQSLNPLTHGGFSNGGKGKFGYVTGDKRNASFEIETGNKNSHYKGGSTIFPYWFQYLEIGIISCICMVVLGAIGCCLLSLCEGCKRRKRGDNVTRRRNIARILPMTKPKERLLQQFT